MLQTDTAKGVVMAAAIEKSSKETPSNTPANVAREAARRATIIQNARVFCVTPSPTGYILRGVAQNEYFVPRGRH